MTTPRPHTIVRITDHVPGMPDYSGMTGRIVADCGGWVVVNLSATGTFVSVREDHFEPLEDERERPDRVATIKSRLLAARKGTA